MSGVREENEMEKIFKMLSDYSRVRIISLLIKNRLCVSELSIILQIPISSVSRHLSKLNLIDIIEDEQSAQWVYYTLADKFKIENKLLIEYILKNSQTDIILKNDYERCMRYIESEVCCKDIKKCRERVEQVMKAENNE